MVARSSDEPGAGPAPQADGVLVDGAAAFVTGGARGIGAAVCRQLARAGVPAAFCDLRSWTEGGTE